MTVLTLTGLETALDTGFAGTLAAGFTAALAAALAAGMRRTDEQAQDSARKAASRNPPPRRNKGSGPRPSAPKLVEGPAISRSSGRAIREPRYGHDESGYGEQQAPFGRQADPRDLRDTRGRGLAQPDPTQTGYGYIGAEAGQKRRYSSDNNHCKQGMTYAGYVPTHALAQLAEALSRSRAF